MGPHRCHYCGTYVNWSNKRTAAGCLIAEHVDGDHLNNDPENLVPSCQTCNLKRARDHRFEDGLFVILRGVRQKAEKRVCWTCEEEFLVPVKDLKVGAKRGQNIGRYCSLTCLHRRPTSAFRC